MQLLASKTLAHVRAISLAGVVAACSAPESITAPVRHASVAVPSHYQSYAGSVIVITSEDDGTQYTLDANAQEIRFSDGRVLKLDFDQTTEALAAFHGTIVTDSVLLSLDTFYAGCEDPTQLECDSAYQTSMTSMSDSNVMWRFGSGPDSDSKKKPKDRKKDRNKLADNDIELTSYSDPCSDVANAIIDASGLFKQARTSWLEKAFQYGVAEVANALTKRLPSGSGAATMFGSDVADHQYRRTRVGVLAFTWNSYNCRNRPISTKPIIRSDISGSGGSGSTLTWTCSQQWVEISLDYGATYRWVSVTVCEYKSGS